MFKNVLSIVLLSIVMAFFSSQFEKDRQRSQELASADLEYASMIPMPLESKKLKKDLRKSIFRFAKKHIGTKYKSGGRNPKGFDCSGFTWYVMDHFGIEIPTNSWSQAKVGVKIPLEAAKTGDLIFFGNKKGVNHVGLIIYHKNGKMRVIHSTSSKGVMKEDVLDSGYWKKRILFVRDVIPKV